MNKREKMKQIRDAQKALAKQLENDDRVDNPNLKRGRRSHSEIFNNINTKSTQQKGGARSHDYMTNTRAPSH